MSKKLLLLLFIFFSICVYAQPPSNMPPYALCDGNNDGFETFDLSSQIPGILNGLNPATAIVSFHETVMDSQTGANPITAINSYVNIAPQSQTIYIRVVDSGIDVYYTTMDLVVNTVTNAGSDGSITVCETSLTTIDLYSVITGEQSGGTWSRTTGAGGIFNPIAGTYTPAVGATTSTFSYTVFGIPPCIGDSSLAIININAQPNAGTDGSIAVCGTSSTVDLFSLITGEQSGGTWTRTTGTGGTFIASAGTYTPEISAITSSFIYTILGTLPCIDDLSVATVFVNNCNPLFEPSYSPISQCDDNNDQFAVFDLTSLIPQILSAVNPSDYSVNFYSSLFGAQNDINPILAPSSYVNVFPAVQTVGIRIVNLTTTEVSMSTVDIRVLPRPLANAAVLFFCDTMELPIYNLSDADVQIIAGETGSFVTYYETLIDAQNQTNLIIGGYIPLVNPGQQTLWASVRNPVTDCFSITTLTLNTQNCGDPCPAPTALTATNVTDTTFTLNWTNTNGLIGFIFNRISITPQGVPPSDVGSIIVLAPLSTYVLTGLQADSCYSVYIKKACSTSIFSEWSAPLNICMPNCADGGTCAQALILNAFLDSNNNGIKDSGEVDFNQGNFVYQVNDSGNNQYGTANDGSYYIFDANPSNSYDISFAVNPDFGPYYTSAVSHNDITLPTGSGANNLYFPIANPVPHVDAQVILTPSGQPRPGFSYSNTIYYQNNGSQTIPSGTLTFTKHTTINIASISQTGTTSTANGFTYDFTNLAPFEVRYINVDLSVPTIPTVNLGDLVTNSVTVQIASDINLSNNSSSITQTIVGSYDPNDKMESHGGKIVHSTFTSNDYLYYTIQFENTGTANAEFVRIEDALNNQLDENTFEMVSASHNVDTKRLGSQLTWHFYDIDLPPTSSNPSGSHGYIHFKIKPKTGYAIGDIIPNTAEIYFDYNPPIVTNTFNTEFVLALGNPTFSSSEFNLYPNPAKGIVHIIQNSNQSIENIHFYDLTGKTVKSILNVNNFQTSIDISVLAKGIYFVEISTENNIKQTKKLIIQ